MPVDNEAIKFIDNPDLRFAIWPALDGFCELVLADSAHPEGIPGLTELKCTVSDLLGVLEGEPFEATNGVGTLWLERDQVGIKVSYSTEPGQTLGLAHLDPDEYRRLVTVATRVL